MWHFQLTHLASFMATSKYLKHSNTFLFSKKISAHKSYIDLNIKVTLLYFWSWFDVRVSECFVNLLRNITLILKIYTQRKHEIEKCNKYKFYWKYNLKNNNSFPRMDSQIPFFCGDSLECRTIGSSAALKGAIRNIQQKVGHLGFRIEKTNLRLHKLK